MKTAICPRVMESSTPKRPSAYPTVIPAAASASTNWKKTDGRPAHP